MSLSGHLFDSVVYVSTHRQCALTALNDVRQYLSVEGGQVAVSRVDQAHGDLFGS